MAQRFPTILTPRGVAAPYAYLQKPDYGSTEHPQPRGEWKLNLIIPKSKAVDELCKRLEKINEDAYAAFLAEHKENPPKVQPGKKPLLPYQGDLPFFDDGNGNVVFKMKGYASYIDKKSGESKPITLSVVDSTGKKIEAVPNIAGGSELKAKFQAIPYKWNPAVGASIKLQLTGVMLLKLVEFGGAGEDWSDAVEEGGYVDDSYDQDFSADPDQGDTGSVSADDDF